jgi:hypothetical protein
MYLGPLKRIRKKDLTAVSTSTFTFQSAEHITSAKVVFRKQEDTLLRMTEGGEFVEPLDIYGHAGDSIAFHLTTEFYNEAGELVGEPIPCTLIPEDFKRPLYYLDESGPKMKESPAERMYKKAMREADEEDRRREECDDDW